MSKHVKRYCSILKYLEQADPELYDIIDQLCLARNFLPKRNTAGITFLRPDKDMLRKISAEAFGEDPEVAVNMLQSLILLDNLTSLDDFDAKKSDIPTFLMRKLPVKSAGKGKVTLDGGREVVVDKQFVARKDRANMSVYVISGDPLDLSNSKDIATLTFSKDVKAKKGKGKVRVKKRGGAEISINREHLWRQMTVAYCNSENTKKKDVSFELDRNPAAELMVTLYVECEDQNSRDKISLLCSADALASLFVVLRPFASEETQELYVDNVTLGKAVSHLSGSTHQSFTASHHPVELYKRIMKHGEDLCRQHVTGGGPDDVKDQREQIADEAVLMNVFSKVKQAAKEHVRCMKRICPSFTIDNETTSELIATAEAEARITFALWHEEQIRHLTDNLYPRINRTRSTLDRPYFLDYTDLDWIKSCRSASAPFLYSMLLMALRSDAFYRPDLGYTEPLASIVNDDARICLGPMSRLSDLVSENPVNQVTNIRTRINEVFGPEDQ